MDTATNEQGTADNVGKNTESVGYASNGSIKKNNVTVQTGLGSISNGEILGIAMDLDNNTVQFYLQGVSRGTAVSIASLTIYDMCKSVDREMVISDIKLIHKSGGKSGEFNAKV